MSISRDLDRHRGDPQALEVLEEDRHQLEAVVVVEVHHLGLVFLPESLEHVLYTLPPLPFLVPAWWILGAVLEPIDRLKAEILRLVLSTTSSRLM